MSESNIDISNKQKGVRTGEAKDSGSAGKVKQAPAPAAKETIEQEKKVKSAKPTAKENTERNPATAATKQSDSKPVETTVPKRIDAASQLAGKATSKAPSAEPKSGSARVKSEEKTAADVKTAPPAMAKKKAVDSASIPAQAQMPDQTTIDRMVAEAAYYLAEKRNFAAGYEEEDWSTAKEQIMTQLQGAKNPLGKKGRKAGG